MMGSIRTDLQMAILEFLGTFTFLLFGLGGIQAAQSQSTSGAAGGGGGTTNTLSDVTQLWYASAAMGLSLILSIWLFYRATGAIFNPNVATALLLIGVIGPVRWVLYCIAQLLAAIAASGVLLALLPGPLTVNTYPNQGTSRAQATFIEMFMTAALVLTVLMLAGGRHRSLAFAPLGIGLAWFALSLFGFRYTNASMNTARSFGPAVVTNFRSSHWIYWVGPLAGSLLAAALYHLLMRTNRYWSLVPTQDNTDAIARAGLLDNRAGVDGGYNHHATGRPSTTSRDHGTAPYDATLAANAV